MTDFEYMTQFELLLKAHKQATVGRKQLYVVKKYGFHLGESLVDLQARLIEGTYALGGYFRFTVYEPKKRTIYAMNHEDKVVQQLLCMILERRLSSHFIYDNVACQKGKGSHFGLRRLKSFLVCMHRRHGRDFYVLKADISKYFASIRHDILKKMLTVKIKDQRVLSLLFQLIDSHHTPGKPGVGIPLGNQTSQWFALYYLSSFDHWVKEQLKPAFYLRYMDDFVLIVKEKERAMQHLKAITVKLVPLGLRLNPSTQMLKMTQGFEFLGWRFVMRVSGRVILRLRVASKKRICRRLKRMYDDERASGLGVAQRVASYRGHLKHGNGYYLSLRMFDNDQRKAMFCR